MQGVESVLCPVVVGRDAQLDVLGRRIDEIVDGHGGLIALVGEAGVGKSRLVREAAGMAEARGLVVLAGRSVPGDTPVPFRPLTEALRVAFRGGGPPDVPELAGFGGQLARLVPDWRAEPGGGADEAPLLVGEAVVRVLRLLGGGRGCLLILEDLHWGDPETLAVVEYLADTLTAEPVLCLLTARPGRSLAIHDLLERLRSRRAATLLPLMALDANEVEEMLASCLATKAVPPGVEQFMDSHSEGLPFLVGLAALPVALLGRRPRLGRAGGGYGGHRRLYGDGFVVDDGVWRGRAVGRPFGFEGGDRPPEMRLLHVCLVENEVITHEQVWVDFAAVAQQLGEPLPVTS